MFGLLAETMVLLALIGFVVLIRCGLGCYAFGVGLVITGLEGSYLLTICGLLCWVWNGLLLIMLILYVSLLVGLVGFAYCYIWFGFGGACVLVGCCVRLLCLLFYSYGFIF